MCGRFSLAYENWGEMLSYFAVSNRLFERPPRYNLAPGQEIAAIVAGRGERRVGLLRWGLVPSWAQHPNALYQAINARAETLLEKPTFRQLLVRKRCVILADGFYEWQQRPLKKQKQPYRIVTDRPFFGFAGLYDTWLSPDGERLHTCTIITTAANDCVAPIHRRMPVILQESAEDVWLDPAVTETELLRAQLQPFPAERMHAYPVSPMVGNVRNDSPDCLREAAVHD
ncbi:MAG: SOS response-associated peptidase [Alicyclobacillus sp.]|nr:SOS response-associated peptidase [Alicyclobacillus sp.]